MSLQVWDGITLWLYEVWSFFVQCVDSFMGLSLFLIPVGIFVVGAAIGLVKRIF